MNRLIANSALFLLLFGVSARADQIWILGDNSQGQKNITIDAASVLQISCGREHLVALRRDGTVSAWGFDGNGRATPPEIQGAVSVSAGAYHSLALLRDGTIVAWGVTNQGITRVPKNAVNVIEVAAGSFHSLALRADGSVVGWGYNGENRAAAPSNLSGVVAIAAGRDHSVALKRNGQVVCWGANDAKQCDVPAGLDRVVAISAGDLHTVALKSDGTLVAWGANQDGRCNVPVGLSQVIAVTAGHRHSVALKADGTAVAWGNNDAAQAEIPGDVSGVVAISAGGLSTALLRADGARITSQPQSRTVLAGRSVEFNVGAVGSGALHYQWYFNGLPVANSSRVQGAGQAQLSIEEIQRADAGTYSVDVFDGTTLIRSANALLVVRSLVQMDRPVISEGFAKIRFGDSEGETLSGEDVGLYQMQWSPDLEQWFDLPSSLTAESGRLVGSDLITQNIGSRFYRLVPKK
jgi:hypothetical protein